MPTTLNASTTSNGLVASGDASGVLALQSSGITGLSVGANGKISISNTALETASAGTLEYDGRLPYFTPLGTQRGVIPGMQYYRLDTGGFVGADTSTTQNTYGVGVTLSANTVYAFEGYWVMSKTSGLNSATLSYGYGGTATLNNIIISLLRYGQTSALPFTGTSNVSVGLQVLNTAALTTATGAITTASFTDSALVKGTVSINAGGTFIPQYKLSAAPGGAFTTLAGSYFLIYPIGAAGANVSIGTWA